jgi:aryl-alcohol dehydrogenase-like predicted oxidoreductase
MRAIRENTYSTPSTLPCAASIRITLIFTNWFREGERELFPLAQEEGLAVIPFNPLAGGLLSGKYNHGDTPEKGRFSAELGGFGQSYRARYWHER